MTGKTSSPINSPTLRHCPTCETDRRLVDFRRWDGRHRTLHVVCNICEPPLSLLDMSTDQRLRVRAKGVAGDVSEYRVHLRDERVKYQGHMRISAKAKARANATRRRNWMMFLLTPLRQEHRWARRNLDKLRQAGRNLPNWERFFALYASTLARIRSRAHEALMRSTLEAKALRPTQAQASPLTYLQADEWSWLRLAFTECERRKGGRVYRDPWLIHWGDK